MDENAAVGSDVRDVANTKARDAHQVVIVKRPNVASNETELVDVNHCSPLTRSAR